MQEPFLLLGTYFLLLTCTSLESWGIKHEFSGTLWWKMLSHDFRRLPLIAIDFSQKKKSLNFFATYRWSCFLEFVTGSQTVYSVLSVACFDLLLACELLEELQQKRNSVALTVGLLTTALSLQELTAEAFSAFSFLQFHFLYVLELKTRWKYMIKEF